MTIRILIADDNASMRGALTDLLSSEPGCVVVGAAADSTSAIELARVHRPEVAILDVKMPGGGGVLAAEGIRRASPDTHIVALSAWEDQETMRRMRRAGASSYVVKGAAPDDLIAIIDRISELNRLPRGGTGTQPPAATIAGSSPSQPSR
jgi:DNA-binding NarL/FixJ family response regulator